MKKTYVIILALLFVLSGCKGQETDIPLESESQQEEHMEDTIDLTSAEPSQWKTEDFAEKSQDLSMQEVSLSKDADAASSTFCVTGDMLYYVLDYTNYYQNNEGTEEKDFDKAHNTQIRMYDMKSQTDSLLYQYDEDFCIRITDMQCDGKVLIWEDYNVGDDSWRVLAYNLSEAEQPEVLFAAGDTDGRLDTITPSLVSDAIYWYDMIEAGSEYTFSLYRFDMADKKISVIEETSDTGTPYTHVAVSENVLATYTYEDDTTIITVKGKDGETKIKTSGNISSLQSNGNITAWLKSEEERGNLYIYEKEKDVYITIPSEYIFSFTISNDLLIVNESNGSMKAYNIADKEVMSLREEGETSCGYIFDGTDGKYAEIFAQEEELLKILILK